MLAPTVVQANEMEEKLEAKKGDMHPENEPGKRGHILIGAITCPDSFD